MNIGSLYKVKKYFWLLFPLLETAAPAAAAVTAEAAAADGVTAEAAAAAAAALYSKRYNCEVTYFSPESYILFLEEDEKFKKVLTSEGLIGWTWFNKNYNDCFEEVKSE